jgi:hypothetical protein
MAASAPSNHGIATDTQGIISSVAPAPATFTPDPEQADLLAEAAF